LQQNQLLPQILTDYQLDILMAWRAASTTEMREQCAAQDKSIELLRKKINDRVKRELGDKQAKQSGE
jgi:hypothetical protein